MRPVDERIADRKSYIDHAVRLYCAKKHGGDLCNGCRGLLDYAIKRIDDCPNNVTGIRCNGCPRRCYNSDMADRMGDVLSYTMLHMLLQRDLRKRFKRS